MSEAIETDDITPLLAVKSDQLNADDLLGGPIVVKILNVHVNLTAKEQPMTVTISGGHRPWKPCKTMMRVMAKAWGANHKPWVGKSVKLYRDETVTWGKLEAGGIRILAMSHIQGRLKIVLNASNKTKKEHIIDVLQVAPTDPALTAFQAAVADAIKSGRWTKEQAMALLGCGTADYPSEKREEAKKILAGLPPSESTTEPESEPDPTTDIFTE